MSSHFDRQFSHVTDPRQRITLQNYVEVNNANHRSKIDCLYAIKIAPRKPETSKETGSPLGQQAIFQSCQLRSAMQ